MSITYTSGEPIFLFPDASKVGAGAWVGQGHIPEPTILASFQGERFATTQLHYPVLELKLLAIVDAVETF
jgi:hypothetical protein